MSTDASSTETGGLFSRVPDADFLGASSPKQIGFSMAATWSWGAAVAVCIAVMHTRGIGPALVWTLANMVALAVFGLLYTKVPHVRKWKSLLPMVLLWGFMGFFAVVMNMSTILAVLGGNMDIPSVGFLAPTHALYATIAIGVAIVAFIHKFGLRGSVSTDVYQLGLQFAGAIGILAVGLATGAQPELVWFDGNQSSWMIGAVLGLLTGTTASGMQWQRIETLPDDESKLRAALWGSGIFTLFLLIVFPAGLVYAGGPLQSAMLIVAALAVATSTADSGSALLQYVSQRLTLPVSFGSLVALAGIAAFPFIAEWGLAGIWTFYANVRWRIIIAMLAATLVYAVIHDYIPESVVTAAYRLRFVIEENVLRPESSPSAQTTEVVTPETSDD